jgi:organic hydroperoxide reductase OsmC/OhrA
VGTVKAFRFPVSVDWQGGTLTRASVPGKPELGVAVPPEFRGSDPGVWSPEDLLVAATASCYAVTLASVARRRGILLRRLHVDGSGHVTRREDGRFGFVAIDLRAELEVDAGSEAEAETAARYAKDVCLVGMALDTPVHLELSVNAPLLAAA